MLSLPDDEIQEIILFGRVKINELHHKWWWITTNMSKTCARTKRTKYNMHTCCVRIPISLFKSTRIRDLEEITIWYVQKQSLFVSEIAIFSFSNLTLQALWWYNIYSVNSFN